MAEVKVQKHVDVQFPPFSRSPVSIIVPFHGEYTLVSRLARSIVWATRSNPYEIILVDDGSPNDTFVKGFQHPQIKTVRSDKRLGFGAALALGYQQSQQPWLLFLHSDVVVQDVRWMIELGRSLLRLKDQNVRMISARSDNPGDGYPAALKADAQTLGEDTVLEEGFLPLYCALCHREMFKRIGGFIKPYELYYEDEELAYRMRRYGMKQAVCGRSWVHHDGGATISAIANNESGYLQKAAERSREQCIADMKAQTSNVSTSKTVAKTEKLPPRKMGLPDFLP